MKIERLFCSLLAVTLCVAVFTPAGFAQTCTGLCLQQVTCPENTTTSVTGTVYAPNGSVPLDNVLVYVPNGGPAPSYGVEALATGASNPPTVSGTPLVSTFSAPDGTFTLANMPAGTDIPLVIQAGKWRRMISIPSVASCTNTAVPASSTSLPQSPAQYTSLDSIPKIGVVTGQFDNLECDLRLIGVNTSQFTDPGGTGAVNFYLGDGGPGAQIDSNTPTENSLWSTQSNVNSYDLLLLPNQSAIYPAASAANQAELVSYANAGGRVFASGFSWQWLYNVSPFSGTAVWNVESSFGSSGTGVIDLVSNAYGQMFQAWLQDRGVSASGSGKINVGDYDVDLSGVIAPSSQWLYTQHGESDLPVVYSFDAPVGAGLGNYLGRVFFNDDLDGETTSGLTTGQTFPAECSNTPATPGQTLDEYLLFNVSGNLPIPQTITFTTPAPASAANNTNFTVAAASTSDQTVSFTGSGGCSYVDNENGTATYTMNSTTNACLVTAYQPGSQTGYAAAPQVTETTLVPQAITFTMNPPPSAYLSPGPGNQFTVAATGGGSNNPVTFTSSGSCTNVGGTYTMSQIPTTACQVIANEAGDGVNYAAAPTITQTVQIGQLWYDLSTPPNQPLTAPYGSSFYTVTGTTTSELPPTYTASGVCSAGPTTEQIVGGIPEWSATFTMTSGTGTCTIQVYVAGNATWAAEPTFNLLPVTTATKATNTINVTSVSPSSEVYGQDQMVTITAVLSWAGSGTPPTATNVSIGGSGLSGSFGTTSCLAPSGDTIACTNTYTPTGSDAPGSYTMSAAFSGDTNYAGSSSTQSNNFSITQATSSASVTSSQNPSLVGQQVTFTATINGEYGLVKELNGGLVRGNSVRGKLANKIGPLPDFPGGATVTWTSNTGCSQSAVTSLPATVTCVTSTLPPGTDTITATYSGDINHSGSTATLSGGQVVATAPGIYAPVNGSTLAGNSATFEWLGYPGATAYWLDVGSTQGGNNYYSTGSLSASTLSQTVNSLPSDGSTVYATWYYLLNGSWVSTGYSYSAFGVSTEKGAITSPAPNSTLTGSSASFTWTAGAGASAYWIDIGSTSGGNNYFTSGNLGNQLTTTVSGLPTNGSTVYVTLYSLVSGQWLSNRYIYVAYNVASLGGMMQSPVPGATLTGSSATFTWSAGAGTSAYWVDISKIGPGGNDLDSSGNLGNVLTETVNNLPTDGSTLYVTLYSLLGSQWVSNAYTYTAANATSGLATMQTPVPGSTLSGNAATFTWSSDLNATAYWVDISTIGPGGNDLDSSGNLGDVLTETVNNLPATGGTIYVTLYSYAGGQWLSTASTYVSGP